MLRWWCELEAVEGAKEGIAVPLPPALKRKGSCAVARVTEGEFVFVMCRFEGDDFVCDVEFLAHVGVTSDYVQQECPNCMKGASIMIPPVSSRASSATGVKIS